MCEVVRYLSRVQFLVTFLATIKSVRILSFGLYFATAQEMFSSLPDLILVPLPLPIGFFDVLTAYATLWVLGHDRFTKKAWHAYFYL